MGSSMQRQALNLKINETAILGTSIEKIIGNNSLFNIPCNKSGIIKYINRKIIITHENIENKTINKNTKKYLFEKIKLYKLYKFKYRKYKKRIYIKNIYNDNNKIKYNKKSKKNEWNKKGVNMVEGNEIRKSISSLGTNLIAAYMIWKGYNFEDAIVINEKLIKKDKLTSIQIKKYKTFLIKDKTGKV